jgi:hypothetical protein
MKPIKRTEKPTHAQEILSQAFDFSFLLDVFPQVPPKSAEQFQMLIRSLSYIISGFKRTGDFQRTQK